MKLSKKSEYAFLALIELAKSYEIGFVKLDGICAEKQIPKKFLQQIMLILKGASYVQTERGQSGGYKLSKRPEDISVAEIVRLFDGPIAAVDSASIFFYDKTPLEQSEKFIAILKDIRDYTANKLENTTIKDLI